MAYEMTPLTARKFEDIWAALSAEQQADLCSLSEYDLIPQVPLDAMFKARLGPYRAKFVHGQMSGGQVQPFILGESSALMVFLESKCGEATG